MRIFLLIFLLAALPSGEGVTDTLDIYSGEVAVEGKEARERNQVLPEALEQVLQKISGLRTFEDYPLVEPALEQSQAILLSFYYRNVEILLADGELENQLRLVAKFSAAKVDEMVRALGLPLWPAERDPIEVWVVLDDGLDRRVMPVEFEYAWQSMADVASRRGLPVHWPIADDEGSYPVDAQLLWGGYTEDLVADPGHGVMIMAARREGVEWGVRSNMSYGGQAWSWRVQDLDLQAALDESLQQAADLVASANVIAASDLGVWEHELTVAGLRNAEDYRRTLNYLQGLDLVSDVSLVSAKPGRATFRLQLSALPRYLEETVRAGGLLEFDEDERRYLLLP